jgi:ribonuclease BN (tRNA processing enzyme)
MAGVVDSRAERRSGAPEVFNVKPSLDVPSVICCIDGMISFLILGAGGAIPTPTHNPAAYWVGIDGRPLLVDPGPGALVRLLASRDGPESIDEIETVLLTHLHLDHCADLAPLLFALHSPIPESERPLQLFGPPGLIGYLDRLRSVYGNWLAPVRRELLIAEIEPGQVLATDPAGASLGEPSAAAEGIRIGIFAAAHPQGGADRVCLGFRFIDTEGRVTVFSGDSEPCEGLTLASRGADLLVVECSTPDEWAMEGHMSPGRVGELCAAAHPGRVVLTHLYPPTVALDLAFSCTT